MPVHCHPHSTRHRRREIGSARYSQRHTRNSLAKLQDNSVTLELTTEHDAALGNSLFCKVHDVGSLSARGGAIGTI